jgi:hypothetical protein
MRETVVPADVYTSWFDDIVIRIYTRPIPAEVTDMPLTINKAILLLLGHFVIQKLADNSIIHDQRMTTSSVLPVESLVDLATWAEHSGSTETGRWRRWMEPAVVVFSERVEKPIGLVEPLLHVFRQLNGA